MAFPPFVTMPLKLRPQRPVTLVGIRLAKLEFQVRFMAVSGGAEANFGVSPAIVQSGPSVRSVVCDEVCVPVEGGIANRMRSSTATTFGIHIGIKQSRPELISFTRLY